MNGLLCAVRTLPHGLLLIWCSYKGGTVGPESGWAVLPVSRWLVVSRPRSLWLSAR